MNVGFIGLGMMGKGMAANLQKAGHALAVYDLNRGGRAPHLAKGRRMGGLAAPGRGGAPTSSSPRCPARPRSRRWRSATTA